MNRQINQNAIEDFRNDLIHDAEFAERQAVEGPFYPEQGITAHSLRAYAAECRFKANGETCEQYLRHVLSKFGV